MTHQYAFMLLCARIRSWFLEIVREERTRT